MRERAAIDDRFVPAKAIAATIRYLRLAEQRLVRPDLAVVSYHMGIGNLQQVLSDYDGGQPVPYAQLYFDTAPDHHGSAFDLLAGFGDDSSLYYWRVLGAMQIMRLYRTDRAALTRLATLQDEAGSNAFVLHPPDRTPSFADPNALYSAYAARTLLRLPTNAARLGLAVNPQMGYLAPRVGATPALYRGLRPAALDLLIELAARVRALSGLQGAADRTQHGARPPLREPDRRLLPGRRHRLRLPDRPPLRRPRPGCRLPGDARPPPGAQPDRLGPDTVDDRRHRGV